MISVSRFLPFVVPYADSVPIAVAKAAIAKSAHLLCTQSLIWQEDFPEMIAHPGGYLEIPVPDFAQVVKIMAVSFDGAMLKPTSREELNTTNPVDPLLVDGTPTCFYQSSLNSIRLVPAPDEHGVVRITVALAPKVDAKKVPDDLLDRFWEVIANGALADIKQITGQSYSDPQAALAYKSLFAAGVREAKNEAGRSFGRTVGRVVYQRIV